MRGVIAEYNPLDYANLTRNCVEELMRQAPLNLPLDQRFEGAGVYALFFRGSSGIYAEFRSEELKRPIYVGKAVPKGGRKGASSPAGSRSLFRRLSEHTHSISLANNLHIEDFVVRYLVVTPLWITMAERFLIEHYKPVWNVCIEGFGNHAAGAGRYEGEVSWWDTLHPGRGWAQKLRQTRTTMAAEDMLGTFLSSYLRHPGGDLLARTAADDSLSYSAAESETEEG